MKKILFLSLLLVLIISSRSYSQINVTAPAFIYGITLNANLATNDFYGTSSTHSRYPELNNLHAMWGRGGALHFKFGLGKYKSNAITTEFEFNQMLHNDDSGESPFMINLEGNTTYYHIFSGILGYEHRIYSRCREKFTMGIGFSANHIVTPSYSDIEFAGGSINKFGIQVSGGLEHVLSADNKWGLKIGAKYHVLNVFDDNNENLLVQGVSKPYIGTWTRRFGVLSFNIGIMRYGY